MQSWVPGQRGEKVHPNCQPTMSEMGSCGGHSGGPEVCHGQDAARTVTGHLTGTAPPPGCRHHSLPPCGLAADSALGSAATLASLRGKPSDQGGFRRVHPAAVCVSEAPRLRHASGCPAPRRGSVSVSGKQEYINDQGIIT